MYCVCYHGNKLIMIAQEVLTSVTFTSRWGQKRLQFVANFLLKSFLKQYFGSRSAKKNRVRTLCGLRHSKSLHFVYLVLEGLGISRSKWRQIFTQLSVKTLVEVTPDISTNVCECNLLDNLVNDITLAKTIVKMAHLLSQEIHFVAFSYRVT